MADRPNVTRMRMIPMAVHPDPVATPFPNAANPDESRIRRSRNNFILRRRRFAWLFDDDFAAGRRFLDINDAARFPFNNAAGQKRQCGGD